jgi:hypothetical protein
VATSSSHEDLSYFICCGVLNTYEDAGEVNLPFYLFVAASHGITMQKSSLIFGFKLADGDVNREHVYW